MHINFTYTLDVSFKMGIDYRMVKRERDTGMDVSQYYSDEETSIYLSYSMGGKYYKKNICYKIKPCEWDYNLKLPLKTHKHFRELGVMLKTTLAGIEKEYLNMRTNELAITPISIKEMINGIIDSQQESDKQGIFWQVYDEFIEEKKQLMRPATIVKYNSLRKTLQEFEKVKYPLTFEGMTMKWYTDFLIYSIDTLKHLTNTTGKNIQMVKSFMTFAYDRKYHRFLEYKRFRVESEVNDPIFLTIEELELIEKYNAASNSSLETSRDIFLIGCYTGQRISDLVLLKKRHLNILKDGSMEWQLYQAKGRKHKAVYIHIIPKARKIIEKHLVGKGDDDFVFPRQSPVVTNRNLKTIGKGAGLNTIVTKVNFSGKNKREITLPKYAFLTTHVARKTTVSLLSDNMQDIEIQSITGHASSKEMRPYRGVDRQKVREGLQHVFEQNSLAETDASPALW